MRYLLSLALAALIGTAALGALEITGADRVKRDTFVALKAEGYGDKAALVWRFDKRKLSSVRVGDALFLVGPPGSYQVECLAIRLDKDGKTVVEEAEHTFVIEGEVTPPPDKVTPKGDPEGARARIVFGRSGCTATVIHPRRPDGKWDLLTAAHCVTGVGQQGTATMASGKKLGVKVSAFDKDSDLAWLVTDDATLELPAAFLAKKLPAGGARIWHMGYGVDKPGNRESGTYVGPSKYEGMIRVDISMSSGDSGSSFFLESTGESIGTMYGTIGGLGHGGSCVKAWSLRPTSNAIAPAGARRPMPSLLPAVLPGC